MLAPDSPTSVEWRRSTTTTASPLSRRVLELLGRDASNAQLAQEEPPPRELAQQPEQQRAAQNQRDAAPERADALGDRLDRVAPDPADENEGPDVEQGAETVEQKEPAEWHRVDTRHRRRDGIESGHELRDQQRARRRSARTCSGSRARRSRARARSGTADEGLWLPRARPMLVPDAVGENGGCGGDRDGDDGDHLAHAGERSDAEQRRDRRQRQPTCSRKTNTNRTR